MCIQANLFEYVKLMVKDEGLLKNNLIQWRRGVPKDGINALFHGPSPGTTWLLQGKAQWCWALRRQAGGEVTMTWLRGGRRISQEAAFEVENVMDVKEGVHMSGLGIYNFHHMLCVEEGGEDKIIYMHLREPPLFKNKVDVFVLLETTAHMQTSLEYGSPAHSPFVPRKGIGGWVLQGLPFDKRLPRSHIGWVWQEANNGAIEFYFCLQD